ncbi:MAG: McrB family protein [Bacteroidia bacterium]
MTLEELINEYCISIIGRNEDILGKHINTDMFKNKDKVKNAYEQLGKTDNSAEGVLRLFFFKNGGGKLKEINRKKKLIECEEPAQQIINAVGNKCKLSTFLDFDENNAEKKLEDFAFALKKHIDGFIHIEEFNNEHYWEKIYKKAAGRKETFNNTIKNNIPNAILEMIYWLKADKNSIPLINGCATDAIKYITEIERVNNRIANGQWFYIKEKDQRLKAGIEAINNLIINKFNDNNDYISKSYFYLDQFFNLLHKLKVDEIGSNKLYIAALDYIKQSPSKRYQNSFNSEFDNSLNYHNNIIFTGAPGTGKTYIASENIKRIIELNINDNIKNEERFELVQFHPSYTYEDFIEGIKPVPNTKNNQIEFNLLDGIFRMFCDKARAYEKEFKENKQDLKYSYFFLIDEINRAELSRVFGELLYCMEYRGKEIKTQYSAMRKTDKQFFSIPENVFIFATMNDIDKSIDSFDLALRRRFLWIPMYCEYDVIENILSQYENIEDYLELCKNLNNYISKTEKNGIGLGKSYEIGHAYYLKIVKFVKGKEITQKDASNLFEYHLSPLIKEYLRSKVDEMSLDKQIENCRSSFSFKISN